MTEIRQEPHKSTITIENGQVVSVDEWMELNGYPSRVHTIERRENNFYIDVINEECTELNGDKEGTLEEVLTFGMHKTFHKKYQKLFALKNATEKKVRSIKAFKDDHYKIVAA